MLGGLPAQQGSPGDLAGGRDAGDDRGDTFGDDLARGDVVRDEQRLGTDDDQVVHEHADEVETDRVVAVECLGDGHLGADAVRGRRQHGVVVVLERRRVEEPGESAQPTQHFGTTRPGDMCLHQLDGAVTGLDVDAGCGVRAGGLTHRFPPAAR